MRPDVLNDPLVLRCDRAENPVPESGDQADPGADELVTDDELVIEELPAFDVALMQSCGDAGSGVR
jgi:hypothetical protein